MAKVIEGRQMQYTQRNMHTVRVLLYFVLLPIYFRIDDGNLGGIHDINTAKRIIHALCVTYVIAADRAKYSIDDLVQ